MEIMASDFRKGNPDLTLANSGWAGCRVTFWREADESRTSVDLYILPKNYCGEREGFSLTVKERLMAYGELDSRGTPIDNYIIEKAEMFQLVLEKKKDTAKLADLLKSAEGKSMEQKESSVPKELSAIER